MGEERLEGGERDLLRRTKIDDGAGQIPAGKECAWNPWGWANCLGPGVSSSAHIIFSMPCEGLFQSGLGFLRVCRASGFPQSFQLPTTQSVVLG